MADASLPVKVKPEPLDAECSAEQEGYCNGFASKSCSKGMTDVKIEAKEEPVEASGEQPVIVVETEPYNPKVFTETDTMADWYQDIIGGRHGDPSGGGVAVGNKRRKHKCQFCQYYSDRAAHVKEHERIHRGERPFGCAICFKKFSRKFNLTMHMKRVHEEGKKHVCETCGFPFRQMSYLLEHQARYNH